MIRVLIVEDDALYRRVIVLLLERQPDIEVVGEAGSLSEARTMLEGADVAILDRVLPDGIGLELIEGLREASPGVKVLVMSVMEELANPQEPLGRAVLRYSPECLEDTCKTEHSLSGAEGIRTPDLRRTKAARYFAEAF